MIDKESPHFKGTFESIYAVIAKYPLGGAEGDYVEIMGWAHYWNPDRGTWTVSEHRDEYWDELLTGVARKTQQVSDKVDSFEDRIDSLATSGTVSDLRERTDALEAFAGKAKPFVDNAGKANGMATLDSGGYVPQSQLPETLDEIVVFDSFMEEEVDFRDAEVSDTIGCVTVFNKLYGSFILRRGMIGADGTVTYFYYPSWKESRLVGEPSSMGVKPVEGKVYVCKETNEIFALSAKSGEFERLALPSVIGEELIRSVSELFEEVLENNTKLEGVTIVNLNASVATPYYTLAQALAKVKPELRELGVVVIFLMADAKKPEEAAKWTSYQWKAVENTAENWENVKLWEKFGGGGASVGNTFNVTVEIPLPTGEYYSDIKAQVQDYNVLEAVAEKGIASLGVQITFAIGVNSWKTYQYIGVNTEPHQVVNPNNWLDLAGMSAGMESMININKLCGDNDYTLSTAVNAILVLERETGINYRKEGLVITYRTDAIQNKWECKQYIGKVVNMTVTNESDWMTFGANGESIGNTINLNYLIEDKAYTLATAVERLVSMEQETGLEYLRTGMVITYKTTETANNGAPIWAAYQLTRQPSDARDNPADEKLWVKFGGGGAVETKTVDVPQAGSKEPLSAGGAYNVLPATMVVDTEEQGVVKMKMVNAAGEDVGDEVQFAVGTSGGGEVSGTIITITPEESPLYAQAGGAVMLRAAIRSVTTSGSQEVSNMIERVELIDRDTNQTVEVFKVNKASSADAQTFDFVFDLSKYFTIAAQRRFKIVAYDDTDRSGSRNVNVTAVDVSIKSEQTLNWTSTTALAVGGATKTPPMYKFPNNASDKGILCTTEILINGEWRELGQATISDTYTHSISINPNNCCGEVLQHGAYALRIHGVDVASGVEGNYLHTSIMVIDAENHTPIVLTRWLSEKAEAEVMQYETIAIDYAAYSPSAQEIEVNVAEEGTNESVSVMVARGKTERFTKRVQGYKTDGSHVMTIKVTAGGAEAPLASTFRVKGSLLDIEAWNSQLVFDMDMSERSNSDADKRIVEGGHELKVIGANYSTNGFVKDSFGTDSYGTETDKGVMALRIAENVKAEMTYKPFNTPGIEANGFALQFKIRTKHVADDEARLIECMSDGYGFYVTGKKVVFTSDGEATTDHTITAALKDDSVTDVAIVIGKANTDAYAGIGNVYMYFDGELIGACYYTAGTLPRHDVPITMDGSKGDLYLYNIRAWDSAYKFEQSFNNYLLKLSDSAAMIDEYRFNSSVMASQTAGDPANPFGATRNRPQAQALYDIGIPYFVITKNADTDDRRENYPEYIETLKSDKKTQCIVDLYAYFPDRPWQSFVAIGVIMTNQGTTSSGRPVKNKKFKTKKCKEVRLLYTREQIAEMFGGDAEILAKYDECAKNAAAKKVQPKEGSVPTNIITAKVDYSESGGANNGASATLYNELQRALGAEFMTPAQNAYTGKYNIGTSIDSIPCAMFQTDRFSPDATLPSNAYFNAKANWNDDKGDAAVFGFEKVDGYNKGCLNYGDFYEVIAPRSAMGNFEAWLRTVDKSQWNFAKDETSVWDVVIVTEFCGPKYKVFRKQTNGTWLDTTGTMRHDGTKWVIEGDVLNPVDNFEIKTYDGLSWFQGVNTVDDMFAADGSPKWIKDFESRYPDNDDLNAAYEDGRKVPYNLYNWLRWCNECSHRRTEAEGDVTVDGNVLPGTKENRLKKFAHELHKVANVKSLICYHVFTDYKAAVDQRSKNMMVGFYLDKDGVVRMYLNHLYDGDTILGSDNDCGLTIPAEVDPNDVEPHADGSAPSGRYYQGWDSVLFRQLAAADYIWLKDYKGESDTSNQEMTTTVAAVAKTMRAVKLQSGLEPFSPKGVDKYWVTDRLSKWPKLVSSFDGMRKYIENSSNTENYYYALHGLSIQRLQDYVQTRFRFRDGFYKCGDIFKKQITLRCVGQQIRVKIKAAKDGFFGIGLDQAEQLLDSAYLKAGEEYTLKTYNDVDQGGKAVWVYGADNIAELDLSNATPKQSGWGISALLLLRKIVIGGEGFVQPETGGDPLASIDFGQLPFLEEVDIRNTMVSALNAKGCPRLKKVLARGSKLSSIQLAETSPVEVLELPETMQTLSFVNLPNISYPGGGLTVEGFRNVRTVQLSGCKAIKTQTLLKDIVDGGAQVKEISIPHMKMSADDSILRALMVSGAKGIGSSLDAGCDGLSGEWILEKFQMDDALIKQYEEYFPLLRVLNAQWTCFMFDDAIAQNNTENITNLDNGTTGEDYEPSGHLLKVTEKSHAWKATYDSQSEEMLCKQISDADYTLMADGSSYDPSDNAGENFDVMKNIPEYWYKGVNDYKNQRKYFFISSLDDEPMSSATVVKRKTLAECLKEEFKCVYVKRGGVRLEKGDDVLVAENSSENLYEVDVEGMAQVRWPGVMSDMIGAVFVDKDGKVVEVFNMYVANALFDFIEGEYVFTSVPEGAVRFMFSSMRGLDDLEVIAVDSEEVEAIEPDWVKTKERLVGVYQASVDARGLPRSLSGRASIRGKVDSDTATSPSWKYDKEGNVTNLTVPSDVNYSMKDLMNMCEMRGKGYQSIDYEMSKDLANLIWATIGDRDAQTKCGAGCSASYTTGSWNLNMYGNTTRITGRTSGQGNLMWGLQCFVACTAEWMDNVGINIPSFKQFKKDKLVAISGYQVTNPPLWHIFDPMTGTERVVKGTAENSGRCIARVRFGRFCDNVPSRVTNLEQWDVHYSDAQWYSGATGRVVFRAHYYANAYGGLAYAFADGASSRASTSCGCRLAFCGKIRKIE